MGEASDFDPGHMLRALESNMDYNQEELMGFWGVYVEALNGDELDATQNHLENHISWNQAMGEIIEAERVKRQPTHQPTLPLEGRWGHDAGW